MNKYTSGYILMLVSATTFAFSSVVAKWAYARGFTPLSFTLSTSVLTVLLFLPLLRRAAWRRPAGAPWWALVLHPLTGAGSGIFFNASLAYLDVSLATLLVFLYPAAVVLGAWLFFRQRPTALQTVAMTLTVAGAVLTAGPVGGEAQWLGIGLALATMLSHTTYMLLGERIMAGADPKATLVLTRLATGLLVVAVQPRVVLDLGTLGPSNWGFLLFGTLVAVVLPFWSLLEGIGRLGASRAAIISTAELPAALLMGWFLMGDRLTWLQGLGALLITAALLLMHRPEGREPGAA
jgi:drug/metabolite transporter (DMT)-like permease